MKKIIFIIICYWLFVSCDLLNYKDPYKDPYEKQAGFYFQVYNRLNEQKNAIVTIGGMKEGKFIGTDSYYLPPIKNYNDITLTEYIGQVDDERWHPDLSKILAISDTAYFQMQLEGGEKQLILNMIDKFDKSHLAHIPINENTVIRAHDGNDFIYISIVKADSIIGYCSGRN